MAVEEELAQLEDDLRRLNLEYETYFNGNSKGPSREMAARVESAITKFSREAASLNFSQSFKFHQLLQRYAAHSDLWRRKLREKEESKDRVATPKGKTSGGETGLRFEVVISDPDKERDKVDRVVEALVVAKRAVGEPADSIEPVVLCELVHERVRQVKASEGCSKVQASVSIEERKVRLNVIQAD